MYTQSVYHKMEASSQFGQIGNNKYAMCYMTDAELDDDVNSACLTIQKDRKVEMQTVIEVTQLGQIGNKKYAMCYMTDSELDDDDANSACLTIQKDEKVEMQTAIEVTQTMEEEEEYNQDDDECVAVSTQASFTS